MKKLLHALFGCSGWPDHERDENGVWWIGMRCNTCGQLKHKTKSAVQDGPSFIRDDHGNVGWTIK